MKKQLLADLIQEYLRKSGMSQREFSDLCDKSHGAVNKWINQESFPNDVNLERIAEVIDWPLDALKIYLKTGKKPDFNSDIEVTIDCINRLPARLLPRIIHHTVDRMSKRASEAAGTYP